MEAPSISPTPIVYSQLAVAPLTIFSECVIRLLLAISHLLTRRFTGCLLLCQLENLLEDLILLGSQLLGAILQSSRRRCDVLRVGIDLLYVRS